MKFIRTRAKLHSRAEMIEESGTTHVIWGGYSTDCDERKCAVGQDGILGDRLSSREEK